jgi:Mg2+/Co2+ transporter CorB
MDEHAITVLDWIYFGVIFVLLLLSAFFAGSETALTAASRPMMHQLEHEGSTRARHVNRLLHKREELIGALLLGNTMVNILASALATSVAIGLYGEAGVAYATAIMTVIVVAFGEVLPKTYAIRNANKMALFLAPAVRGFIILLSPILKVVNILVRASLRLIGDHGKSGHDAEAAMIELKGAIEIHASGAENVKHERAMLRSILELDDVDVGEIMTHRKSAFTIDAALPPAEIVSQVLAGPYTRVPLWRDNPDNIVGVLHAKELLRAVRAHEGDLSTLDVGEIASLPWFIPDTTSLLAQLQAFRDRHEHFAIVIDEYGSLKGVVTLEDIIEEIVGDIRDECDVSVSGVRPQSDGSLIISGHVTIRDLNREFEWRLPDEEASTIAGLVLHEARRIPEVGQQFLFHGFRFEILRRHRNQIALLRVIPPLT